MTIEEIVILIIFGICTIIFLFYFWLKEDETKECKIIKKGDTRERKYKTTCQYCGCEFVFTDSEWQLYLFELQSMVTCPCCGKRIEPVNKQVISHEEYQKIISGERK